MKNDKKNDDEKNKFYIFKKNWQNNNALENINMELSK